jgi:predicted porin
MLTLFFRTTLVFFICVLSIDIHAQPTVTLYGIVDAGLLLQQNSGDTAAGSYEGERYAGFMSGGQSANRLGVAGQESLGGGYVLNFKLENGLNLGNGTAGQGGALFGRQAWFGLQNNEIGYIRFGRQNNFASDYAGVLSPWTGDFSSVSMGASFGSANAERMSNAIKIETASLAGFKLGAGYSFAYGAPAVYANDGPLPDIKDASTATYNYSAVNNVRVVTSGATYTAGPLYVMTSYDVYMPSVSVAEGNYKNATAWILGASYKLDPVTLTAAYGQSRNGWANSLQTLIDLQRPISFGNADSSIVFNGNVAVDSYALGLTAVVDEKNTVFAIVQRAEPTGSMRNNMPYISSQSMIGFGYVHDLSRRTNLYAFTGYVNNYALVDGVKSGILGLGMRHVF